jgi:CheY-specific phosphatase CheX
MPSRAPFDTTGGLSYTAGVRQEIIAAFVEAVRQVFQETDMPVQSVDSDVTEEPSAQVIISVGLTGDLRGIFQLRTDMPGAAGIFKAMTGGRRLILTDERLNEIQLAAMGEISNQVSGRAITILSDIGLRCDITPPAALAAPALQSVVPDFLESFRHTFRGPFGTATIYLGLQRPETADPFQKTS